MIHSTENTVLATVVLFCFLVVIPCSLALTIFNYEFALVFTVNVLIFEAISPRLTAALNNPVNASRSSHDTGPMQARGNIQVQELDVVRKEPTRPSSRKKGRLEPGRALVVSFVVGSPENPLPVRYREKHTCDYLRQLLRIDPKLTILLLSQQNQLIASTDGLSMVSRVGLNRKLSPLLLAMEKGDLDAVSGYMPLSATFLAREDSDEDVLDAMLKDDVCSMIAVDSAQNPIGVFRRDDILARLSASITRPEDA